MNAVTKEISDKVVSSFNSIFNLSISSNDLKLQPTQPTLKRTASSSNFSPSHSNNNSKKSKNKDPTKSGKNK